MDDLYKTFGIPNPAHGDDRAQELMAVRLELAHLRAVVAALEEIEEELEPSPAADPDAAEIASQKAWWATVRREMTGEPAPVEQAREAYSKRTRAWWDYWASQYKAFRDQGHRKGEARDAVLALMEARGVSPLPSVRSLERHLKDKAPAVKNGHSKR